MGLQLSKEGGLSGMILREGRRVGGSAGRGTLGGTSNASKQQIHDGSFNTPLTSQPSSSFEDRA